MTQHRSRPSRADALGEPHLELRLFEHPIDEFNRPRTRTSISPRGPPARWKSTSAPCAGPRSRSRAAEPELLTGPDRTDRTGPRTGPDGPDMWPSGRDRRGEIWRALTGKNFQFSGAGSQTRANRRLAPACEDPVLGANQSQALLVDLLCANFALERLRRGNGVLCEEESRGVPRLLFHATRS